MKQRLLLVVSIGLAWAILGAHPSTQQPIIQQLATGSATGGLDTERSLTLANSVAATTVTARNLVGSALAEKNTRWTSVSFPASGSQGTATIAAEAAVRHVVDCVTWAADSSAAVVASAGNLAVRDGATGAGTVIWQVAIAHLVAAAAGVQTIAPNTVCGLNLAGTTNTAMTAELNAGVTGEVQSVSMSGFNIN